MATVLTIKSLASGQLGNTQNPIYTVASATSAIVNDVVFTNTDTVNRTVNVWVLPNSGTARRVCPKDLVLGPKYSLILDDAITLGAGDSITAMCDTADVIDFVVNGVEES